MISEVRKLQYWNHFTGKNQKGFRPKNITDLRLKLMKESILEDSSLWQEVILNHDAVDKTPDELLANSAFNHNHARLKFWAIMRKKIERQSYRSKR
jgi:hypothetical protein